ncbi:energy-coupling factor ABC transporter permease [Aliiglaciecola sp. LCG003]|uniref:energy-coupling factor ABC transporter permease n=1 Tax=Aliiglaciecola sp. LCG003 TaxID=3053655 RepID=UPI0025723CE0|nr:energy-coupling factor ABC transporter permease [Aliiglaciecola sp. LCG003]WJG07932.1 energy-coupling factor ABC transporter permease [Aliiglaciecola sp. LCG003]
MFDLTFLQICAWLLYAVSIAVVIYHVDFKLFASSKKTQHLVLGASVSVFGLWLFRVGVTPGLDVHFLWLTALTLLLGLRWALLSGAITLLVSTVAGYDSWAMFGVNGLLGVTAPIGLSYLIYSFSFHKLPRHFFVYVFVCAFFAGAAMIALKMLLLGGYFYLEGAYDTDVIVDTYLMLIPLLVFSEAMLNGMTMTLLIIYKPSWVYTFYDKYYLDK